MVLTKLTKYCQLTEVYPKVKLCIITNLNEPYQIAEKRKGFERVVAKVVVLYYGLSQMLAKKDKKKV